MADKKIGKVFIEFTTKGFDKLKATFGEAKAAATTIGGKLQAVAKDFKSFADKAAVSFAGLSASVLGFVAVASPQTVERLQGALGQLAVQIGRILVPIVKEFTSYIQSLTNWFRNLSDSQRTQIVFWVNLAGTILLCVVAAQKFQQALMLVSANPILLVGAAVAILINRMQALEAERLKQEEMGKQTASKAGGNISEEEHELLKGKSDKELETSKAELQKRMDARLKSVGGNFDLGFLESLSFSKKSWNHNKDINAQDLDQKALAAVQGEQNYRKGKGKLGSAESESSSRFGVELQSQKPQLMGIADAWRKAQQADQGETKELMILKEQLQVIKESNANLEKIAKQKQGAGV